MGHSIAETLNYQFGFEVSKTWFYQLLSRAFVPLVVLGILVMFLISTIVIVPEGNQAVLFRSVTFQSILFLRGGAPTC